MDIDQFWDLVEEARGDAVSPRAAEETISRATALLAAREPQEIIDAQRILQGLMAASYQAPLWAAAYLVNGGCSDDGFEYFRGWLIAQGRGVYEHVVADADRLASLDAVREAVADGRDLDCEDTLTMAWQAYREATGEDLPAGAFTVGYPDLDPAWNFDFDDSDRVAARLPRVAALCRVHPA